jgi:hypothetical protein
MMHHCALWNDVQFGVYGRSVRYRPYKQMTIHVLVVIFDVLKTRHLDKEWRVGPKSPQYAWRRLTRVAWPLIMPTNDRMLGHDGKRVRSQNIWGHSLHPTDQYNVQDRESMLIQMRVKSRISTNELMRCMSSSLHGILLVWINHAFLDPFPFLEFAAMSRWQLRVCFRRQVFLPRASATILVAVHRSIVSNGVL